MALLKQKVDGVWVTVPLVNKLTIDSTLSDTSVNPVQNKVITEELNNKLSLSGGTIAGILDILGSELYLNNSILHMAYGLYPSIDIVPQGLVQDSACLSFFNHDTGDYVELSNLALPTTDSSAANKQYVDSAISAATANITTDIFSAGTTAPENTKLLWIDTANSNTMKFYNTETSAWDNIGAVWS